MTTPSATRRSPRASCPATAPARAARRDPRAAHGPLSERSTKHERHHRRGHLHLSFLASLAAARRSSPSSFPSAAVDHGERLARLARRRPLSASPVEETLRRRDRARLRSPRRGRARRASRGRSEQRVARPRRGPRDRHRVQRAPGEDQRVRARDERQQRDVERARRRREPRAVGDDGIGERRARGGRVLREERLAHRPVHERLDAAAAALHRLGERARQLGPRGALVPRGEEAELGERDEPAVLERRRARRAPRARDSRIACSASASTSSAGAVSGEQLRLRRRRATCARRCRSRRRARGARPRSRRTARASSRRTCSSPRRGAPGQERPHGFERLVERKVGRGARPRARTRAAPCPSGSSDRGPDDGARVVHGVGAAADREVDLRARGAVVDDGSLRLQSSSVSSAASTLPARASMRPLLCQASE